KWNIICRPKDQEGLGIEVLDIKNKCLLSKWLFKLLSKEGVCHELLSNKYLRGEPIFQVQERPTISPFWEGLMGVKNGFFNRGSFCVGDGTGTQFWEDTWLGDTSLENQYPTLYSTVRTKEVLVADVLSQNPLNIRFNKNLVGEK